MGAVLRQFALSAMQIEGSPLRQGAILCTVARAVWPDKTAANWAAEAGREERVAKYWLAGSHPIPDCARLALMRVLMRA